MDRGMVSKESLAFLKKPAETTCSQLGVAS